MHVNLEAAEFMSDILKESRNKTGKLSPFTTWKGTLRVFYLAQSGNRVSITMGYLARLFQPMLESKQLVFSGAARGADTRSPSPQYSPTPGRRGGGEGGMRPLPSPGGAFSPRTWHQGQFIRGARNAALWLYTASVCFPLCAGCSYINPLWVSVGDSW